MSSEKQHLPISAVIITLNEEANIERCLKSLDFCAEIVVCDTGSTDRTQEIAKELGAKVIHQKWLGFGPTKSQALGKARFDWILSVDADEEVSVELKDWFFKHFEKAQPSNLAKQANLDNLDNLDDLANLDKAYAFSRLSFYLERWIHYGGWFPDYQIRLFNRLNYDWDQALIHEKIQKKDRSIFKPELIKVPLLHYVFKNIQHQVQTNNRYSSLQAQDLFEKNVKFRWHHFLTKPYVKFIECYFFKKGFLDGWPGYLIARNAAYSVFLKWAKLKELEDQKRRKKVH